MMKSEMTIELVTFISPTRCRHNIYSVKTDILGLMIYISLQSDWFGAMSFDWPVVCYYSHVMKIAIIIACCNCTKQLEHEIMSLESASINSDTSFGNESVLEIKAVG